MANRRFRWALPVLLTAWPLLLWAMPGLQSAGVKQIPAVAVSNAPDDPGAPHLAWIVAGDGTTKLMVGALTGKDAHTVAVPGSCTETGLRWANSGYPLPRTKVWHELAVMTHCGGGSVPMHSVIWLLDADRADAPPRKIADLAGYAHCMLWTAQDKGIAFLYVPGARHAPTAPTAGNCQSRGIDAMQAPASDAQRVGMVSLATGKLETVTPPGMTVYEFAWTTVGHQALLYVATPPGETRWDAKLYRKWGNASLGQWMVEDPVTSPALRGRHISMPSWDPGLPMVQFLGIKNVKGVTGGDLYHVAAAGGKPVNLTRRSDLKPSWITPGGRIGTVMVDGKVEVLALPTLDPPYTTTKVLFSVPGTLSDGRAPLAFASGFGGMAYVQSSADSGPEVHAGSYRASYGPPIGPPAVTSINDDVHVAVGGKR